MVIVPVDDGTHVQADILETSNHALLYGVQVHQLLVHVDELHAAVEGALRWREVRPWKIACVRTRELGFKPDLHHHCGNHAIDLTI